MSQMDFVCILIQPTANPNIARTALLCGSYVDCTQSLKQPCWNFHLHCFNPQFVRFIC
jgi:hypothetical protein